MPLKGTVWRVFPLSALIALGAFFHSTPGLSQFWGRFPTRFFLNCVFFCWVGFWQDGLFAGFYFWAAIRDGDRGSQNVPNARGGGGNSPRRLPLEDLTFHLEKCSENPPGTSSAKSSEVYTTKYTTHFC